MKLGMQVGLGPGYTVLYGDPAAPMERGTAAPHIRNCLRPYNLRSMSTVAKQSPISATAEHLFECSLVWSQFISKITYKQLLRLPFNPTVPAVKRLHDFETISSAFNTVAQQPVKHFSLNPVYLMLNIVFTTRHAGYAAACMRLFVYDCCRATGENHELCPIWSNARSNNKHAGNSMQYEDRMVSLMLLSLLRFKPHFALTIKICCYLSSDLALHFVNEIRVITETALSFNKFGFTYFQSSQFHFPNYFPMFVLMTQVYFRFQIFTVFISRCNICAYALQFNNATNGAIVPTIH